MSADSKASTGSVAKRVLVGRAFSSHQLEHTLLPKVLALPVFASDALSSVAYATGEILIALTLATTAPKSYVMPIAVAIAALMAIVVSSYRQTVRAYPGGGGAYIVSKENLGTFAGLVAAAALLFDYMMTVVVSIVAGVFAIGSAFPWANEHKVLLSILFVALVTIANLRGARESGTLFAIPTYGFVVVDPACSSGSGSCDAWADVRPVVPASEQIAAPAAVAGITVFALLKAFSQGATALTGVEAISNGVPAFKRPQAKNAAATLAIMGTIAVTMFLGISYLATHVHGVVASEQRSVVAQITVAVFGNNSLGFFVVQAFTAAILILAANTAYQDFPRLASILGRDRFMPSQFVNRGDRLVFSNGVVALGLLSALMIYALRRGPEHADPLLRGRRVHLVHAVAERHDPALARRGPQGRRRDEGLASFDRDQHHRRDHDLRRADRRDLVEVQGRCLALDPDHGAARPGVLRDPPALHVDPLGGAPRCGKARGGRHHPRGAAGAGDRRGRRRGARLHPIVPAGVLPRGDPRRRGGARPGRALVGASPGLGAPPLEPLGRRTASRAPFGASSRRCRSDEHDLVNLVIPEVVTAERMSSYVLRSRKLIRLKASLLRTRKVVVTDVPVVVEQGTPRGVDALPLIPQRTVALVFISSVNDLTIRAINYARSLDATTTRAIYFDLDPEAAHRLEQEWFEVGKDVPLDIVEAPFRDLTGPMLEEVRRFSSDPGTVVNVIVPEVIVSHWWQLPLHNQNALFIKQLFLFEDRVVLSDVPMLVKGTPSDPTPASDAADLR